MWGKVWPLPQGNFNGSVTPDLKSFYLAGGRIGADLVRIFLCDVGLVHSRLSHFVLRGRFRRFQR